jgi:hypothetical protein
VKFDVGGHGAPDERWGEVAHRDPEGAITEYDEGEENARRLLNKLKKDSATSS